MTLNEIRNSFRNKSLDSQSALQELSKHSIIGNRFAESLLDEILEMAAEPPEMTDAEREVAAAWETAKKGGE